MMTDADDDQSSSLLREKPQTGEVPFCGCISVQYYRPYFDVDTKDVVQRITNSVLFRNSEQNFLQIIGNRPDAYGPFWISTTLVFTLAVASHLNGWLSSWMRGGLWEYDFQSVLQASSLVYGYALFGPALLWFVFKQYSAPLKFVSVACLYGYSLAVVLPAVLLCLIPSTLVVWASLLLSAVCSTLFLLRSLAPMVASQPQKQAMLLMSLVGILQLSLVVLMKLYFFYSK